MAKKEFRLKDRSPEKKDDLSAGGKEKPAGLSGRLVSFIELLLGICLIPFAYSFTVNFLGVFSRINPQAQQFFWAGVASFLALFLFVWEPEVVFTRSQRIVEIIFFFFKPFVQAAPFLLPICTIIVLAAYGIASLFVQAEWLLNLAMLFTGATIALHLVFSARKLRGKKSDFLKGNYIFGFSFTYIANLSLLVFCLGLVFTKITFLEYIDISVRQAAEIFHHIIKQLFMV